MHTYVATYIYVIFKLHMYFGAATATVTTTTIYLGNKLAS